MYQLSQSNDIIIAAGQSNSIPYAFCTKNSLPVKQHPFLLGLQPDIILLCVNAHDSTEYVHNTIKYLEGAGQCSVCGMVLFPQTYYSDWRSRNNSKRKMSKEELIEVADRFKLEFNRPVYHLNDPDSIEECISNIVHLLS